MRFYKFIYLKQFIRRASALELGKITIRGKTFRTILNRKSLVSTRLKLTHITCRQSRLETFWRANWRRRAFARARGESSAAGRRPGRWTETRRTPNTTGAARLRTRQVRVGLPQAPVPSPRWRCLPDIWPPPFSGHGQSDRTPSSVAAGRWPSLSDRAFERYRYVWERSATIAIAFRIECYGGTWGWNCGGDRRIGRSRMSHPARRPSTGRAPWCPFVLNKTIPGLRSYDEFEFCIPQDGFFHLIKHTKLFYKDDLRRRIYEKWMFY